MFSERWSSCFGLSSPPSSRRVLGVASGVAGTASAPPYAACGSSKLDPASETSPPWPALPGPTEPPAAAAGPSGWGDAAPGPDAERELVGAGRRD